MKSSDPSHTLHPINLGIVLFGIALFVFLLGNGGHSLWGRQEARVAAASRQMFASGDWTAAGPGEPILIYWLQAASMKLVGPNETGARLPAAIAGAYSVLMIYLLGLRINAGPRGAILAAVISMSAGLLLVVAKASTTDAVLVAMVTGMMLLHWEQRSRRFRWSRHVAFWVIAGLSTLLRGAIGPLIVLLAIASEWTWNTIRHSRSIGRDSRFGFHYSRVLIRAVRIGVGALVFAAVSISWSAAAWREGGGEFFGAAVSRHILERMAIPLDGDAHPFFHHAPFVLVALFPWSAVALVGLRHAWSARALPQVRLLWCWLVPALIVLSLSGVMGPADAAPLLPALALMSGVWFQSHEEAAVGRGWWGAGAILVALTGLALMAALIALPLRLNYTPLAFSSLTVAAGIGFGSCKGAWEWWRQRPMRAVAVWAATMLFVAVISVLWLLPAFESTRPSKTLVGWVKRNAPPETRLMAAEFREPSLAFYWGGAVPMPGADRPEMIAQALAERTPTALIVPRDRWEKIQPRFSKDPSHTSVRFTGRYFIINDAKWREMVIVGNWK